LDASVKPLIEKWESPPKAITILDVLDKCIYGALASGTAIVALEAMYDMALVREKTTHEAMVLLASWRSPQSSL
jgi:hypothetical protein